jgi:uncharacterized membrane protein HdeD (DUF308 family)
MALVVPGTPARIVRAPRCCVIAPGLTSGFRGRNVPDLIILLLAYFADELVHYRIISGRLAHDAREWKNEWWIVAIGVLAAIAAVAYPDDA